MSDKSGEWRVCMEQGHPDPTGRPADDRASPWYWYTVMPLTGIIPCALLVSSARSRLPQYPHPLAYTPASCH